MSEGGVTTTESSTRATRAYANRTYLLPLTARYPLPFTHHPLTTHRPPPPTASLAFVTADYFDANAILKLQGAPMDTFGDESVEAELQLLCGGFRAQSNITLPKC